MAIRKNTLLIKRSNIPGNVPVAGQILLGELALNTASVILYASGTTTNSILPIGWDRVARTGDTMTGTLFTPYLSTTTVSATTYLNLPVVTDIRVTGGTPNNAAKTYTFTNNTGGTFNVTALTDINITGTSFTNNILTLTNNTGGTLTTLVNNFSGLTVNGNVTVTGTTTTGTISATTYLGLPIDVRVTGGTYNAGNATFTNNTGGTFNVTGFISADTFTTGFTYSNNTLTIKQNQGQPDLSVLLNITNFFVSDTVTTNTTSTIDVLLSNMTLTPGAGDYIVYFNATESNSNNGKINTFSIYVNGVQVANSIRAIDASQTLSPITIITKITGVLTGQAVEVRWRTNANTAACQQRTLTLIKVL